MKEEAKAPIIELWKKIKPIQWKLDPQQNLQKNLPKHAIPDEDSTDHVLAVARWNARLTKGECAYATVYDEHWNRKGIAEQMVRWNAWAQGVRPKTVKCLHISTWNPPARG
jgi:hypothetical protein